MADPAQIDMDVPTRRVSFVETYTFLDVNWTGSTLKMQVRLVKDTTGAPLFEADTADGLDITYAGTDTVANHVTAGRLTSDIYSTINPLTGVHFVAGDNVTLTALRVGLSIGKLNTVPIPDETGDDVVAWYDVVRIPASGDNELIMRGKFIVRAAVTIP